jgi:hypothetical protein
MASAPIYGDADPDITVCPPLDEVELIVNVIQPPSVDGMKSPGW